MANQLGCSTLTFRMLDRKTELDWIEADGFDLPPENGSSW